MRYPGQYYQAETALSYNYFRDYDPATGRYVESDPIGLQGGINTYGYANENPISMVDVTGLAVTGSWTQPPRFNLDNWSIGWPGFVFPHITKFGYLKFLRFPASIGGYVNIDVHCTDDCNSWDIHQRIEVDAGGSFDLGNLCTGARARADWYG